MGNKQVSSHTQKRCHLKTSENNTMPVYDGANIPLIGDHGHYKFKTLNYINTTDDVHIKLVKSFQTKKEDRNLKLVSLDARDMRKICTFNDATVISHADQ